MTTALVTGVTGQDGTLLARQLTSQGVQVHGLAHSEADRQQWTGLGPAEVVVHVGDLTDADRMAEVVRDVAPDEIYNLAGISSVAFSWQHPVLTGAVTGLGAAGLFELAWQQQERTGSRVRVVQASSAEIFGVPADSPQTERTPVAPASPYGAAKAYAHQMASVYRSRGLHVATCILYNHESPLRPESFVTRKITAAAARIAVEGGGTLALGNLDAVRDWGWAPDYVDALVRAVRHDEAADFVVATGVAHSVAEFVEVAMRRAGVDRWRDHVVVDERFVRPVDPAAVVGDASKARRELGWQPTVSFDEIVGRMVDHDLKLLRGTE